MAIVEHKGAALGGCTFILPTILVHNITFPLDTLCNLYYPFVVGIV